MNIKFITILFIVVFSSISLAGVSTSKETSLYQSVYAESLTNTSSMVKKDFDNGKSPDFIIVDNKLYLKIQTENFESKLYVKVRHKKWDKREIQKLVQLNNNIHKMLPHPKQSNYGIRWIVQR